MANILAVAGSNSKYQQPGAIPPVFGLSLHGFIARYLIVSLFDGGCASTKSIIAEVV